LHRNHKYHITSDLKQAVILKAQVTAFDSELILYLFKSGRLCLLWFLLEYCPLTSWCTFPDSSCAIG